MDKDTSIRIGMICRYDNSGLGTLSWEFARHLKPHKIALVQNHVHKTFPERFADFDTRKVERFDVDTLSWLFDDIDIFFTIETFYDWSIIKYARKKGVKTVLYTMFEMAPQTIPLHPDLYLCPSKLDYDVMPDPKKYLPVPLATDKLVWRERKVAKTFIHSASHGGLKGRKGTQLFLDAIPMVKNQNIKFRIFTWVPFHSADPRVTVEVVNFKNYWQLWREGDVLVYPQDYNGICLPVVESWASGLGVITTDIYPFNEYLTKEMLFKPDSFYKTRASGALMEIEAARISPQKIAEKIDEFAEKDISSISREGREFAKSQSWNKLLPKYNEIFNDLIV